MKGSLTIKDKKAKLSEAFKCTILWSERELCKKHLKQHQNQATTVVASAPSFDTIYLEDSISQSLKSDVSTVLSQSPTRDTIQTLSKTIHDLQIQQRELDITIKVLKKHLLQVSQSLHSPPKSI